MQHLRWAIFGAVLSACLFTLRVAGQDPPPPPPSQTDTPSSNDKSNKKYSHADDFLIIGTVFTEQGYAFPGVQLRVRRAAEKKFRWDTYTNSRGEFAVRVPQGTDYEMIVHAKGFADQSKSLDAKSGVSEARMVFRMEPGKDEKK
jgi:hypothetical protein